MYGAMLGDMAGSIYEFHSIKTKDFPLLSEKSCFTDDTVMSAAVGEVCLDIQGKAQSMKDEDIRALFAASMRKWGQKHLNAGYGGTFLRWLVTPNAPAYNSWGNGSAMRVSAAGWLFKTLEETRRIARLLAEVTHNHAEGIKGAEATASAIYILRTGGTKADVKDYITREAGYDLNRTVDGIRSLYKFDESCQGTVPEAVICFLEAESTEDAIRNAISLGGDADTLGCIAGSIAEAMWGVPDVLKDEVMKRLDEGMRDVVRRIEEAISDKRSGSYNN